MLKKIKLFLVLGGVFMLIFSCKQDQKIQENAVSLENVSIQISEEPDALNPMMSKSSIATTIESFIYQPLVESDPKTLRFKGVLAESVPEGLLISDEEFKGKIAYTFRIRDEAKWDDGSPVTAEDYAFTLKVIFNPAVGTSYKRLLVGMKKVYLSEEDNKSISVVVSGSKFQSLLIAGNWPIYPKYIYDSGGLLDEVDLNDLISLSEEEVMKKYPSLEKFAADFRSEKFNREIIVGSGPYSLESWSTSQNIVLKAKDNYWGESLDSLCLFSAIPNKLSYQIISDQTTALTAFKSGNIDVMPRITPSAFQELKESQANEYNFYTPQIMQYFYIGINTNNPLLEDVRVRRALSHMLDVEMVIDHLMEGLAKRTIGPIHPSLSYYNSGLTPVVFDMSKAEKLLDEAGWVYDEKEKVRKKMFAGEERKLELTLKTSQRELGKQLAIILQDQAKKLGVNIEIESKEIRSILQDVRAGDFHLANLAAVQSPGKYDPYGSWHTDNIGGSGRNYLGFGSEESDAAIEEIRDPRTELDQLTAYKRLQELIYLEQPAIFLFSPLQCIVSQKHIQLETSSLRPGYFPNCSSSSYE